MHMSDALLSPEIGGAMWAATGAAVAVASRSMKRRLDHRQVPLMGVMGALVFATQMINFAIPGTGSSGHFAGGAMLTILLGPHAAFLTMASVLTVQALFFADGGILALGANIFNMGVVPSYIIYPVLYLPISHLARRSSSTQGGFARRAAIWLSGAAALPLGALGVVLETTGSGISALPLSGFLWAMLPIHLAIGVVEGAISVAIIDFLAFAEPEAMRGAGGFQPSRKEEGRIFGARGLAAAALMAAALGGGLSWFASERPDGLEWSVARLIGEGKELSRSEDRIHQAAAAAQEALTILPDYGFPKSEGQDMTKSEVETTISGLLGGVLTLATAGMIGFALRRRGAA